MLAVKPFRFPSLVFPPVSALAYNKVDQLVLYNDGLHDFLSLKEFCNAVGSLCSSFKFGFRNALHRIASDGIVRGVFAAAADYAKVVSFDALPPLNVLRILFARERWSLLEHEASRSEKTDVRAYFLWERTVNRDYSMPTAALKWAHRYGGNFLRFYSNCRCSALLDALPPPNAARLIGALFRRYSMAHNILYNSTVLGIVFFRPLSKNLFGVSSKRFP